MHKHSGHITVESHLGVGTTFHIYLLAFPEKTAVNEEEAEAETFVGKGWILVMDDEDVVRELAADMLTSFGYEVIAAIDGARTVELFRKAIESGHPFDAVVLDLTIPGGMGGKETVQKLIEIDPEVKAIVSSGYSNDPIMANFRQHGFSGFIPKPYKLAELNKVLHKIMTGVQDDDAS